MALLDIYNMALGILGAEKLADTTTDCTPLRVCQTFYTVTKENLLASFDWNFARVRASISKDATAPAFEYSARFALPADCMRILEVVGCDDFTEETGYILCNRTTIQLKYTTNSKAETAYPSVFVNALAARLAANMCYQLTQKTDLRQLCEQLAEKAISQAMHLNAINRTPKGPIISGFDDSRFE